VLPLFLALSSSSLFADQITFRNGDRLTGSIVKSDAATLVIRTTVAGEISVSWPEVQELHSDAPLHVGLSDGKAVVGKVTIHEGEAGSRNGRRGSRSSEGARRGSAQ